MKGNVCKKRRAVYTEKGDCRRDKNRLEDTWWEHGDSFDVLFISVSLRSYGFSPPLYFGMTDRKSNVNNIQCARQ